MLDCVSAAMRKLPTVRLPKLPRMADFALWGTAAEVALGLRPGEFMGAYTGNREVANELAMEASAIGPAVLGLMDDREQWEGTAKELLAELGSDRHSDMNTRRRSDWPHTPHKLSGQLRRLAPNLRKLGVEAVFQNVRTNRGRKITLTRCDGRNGRSQESPFDTPPSELRDLCDDPVVGEKAA